MTRWLTKVSGLSLREKLPLVGSTLIAGTLVVAGTLAYVEVRQTAQDEAEDRLASLSTALEELLEAEFDERAKLQERVTASREVRGALITERVDTADLARVLDSLRSPADGRLPVQVIGPDSQVVFSIGALPDGEDPDPAPPLESKRTFGPLRPVAARNLHWETVPVFGTDDATLGWIAQRRSLATSGSLQRLWGRGIRFRFGQLGDSVWVDLYGERWQAPPPTLALGRPQTYTGLDGERFLATARRVEGTPWVVLLDVSMNEVLARPRAFVARMIVVGALVIFGSVILVWWASRRLTRPLIELAGAADAVSSGDYDGSVDVDGDDEIGRLADAFNRMSSRIARSEAALHARLEEARRLAERLAEARRAAEQARNEAQAANRAKADILASISHEIRTPISAVMAYAELLHQLAPDRRVEKHRKYVQHIEQCTGMLESLTNDLLDFSCIESGQLRMDIETGWVDEAIGVALATLQPKAEGKGIQIENLCSEGAVFRGDRQRVQQIIMNLVSNAVKFTPENGRVMVSCRSSVDDPPPDLEGRTGPWVTIHVSDTGPGIDPDEIERIFEPFARGNGRRAARDAQTPGVGLGLSISRHLALMMSGTITVESRPGDGARFTLWLPLGAQAAVDHQRGRYHDSAAASVSHPPA